MKKFMRGPGSYVLMLIIIVLLVSALNVPAEDTREVSYSQFIKMVEKKELSAIYVVENDAVALKNNTATSPDEFPKEYDVYVYLPSVDVFMTDVQELLGTNPQDYGLTLTFEAKAEPSWLVTMLPYALMSVGMLAFFVVHDACPGTGKQPCDEFW